MGYYDFDNNYYEPSEEEIFLDELKDKFREILREDVKIELERLKEENADLRKTVKEYKDMKSKLYSKERELQYKEENLKREVEEEFYNKTMEEVFAGLLEDSEVWYAERVPHEKPKCNLCNEERMMIATFPNGETVSKRCDCANPICSYEPVVSINKEIEFHKTYKPRYGSDKKIYFTKNYRANKDFIEAYDYYSEFRIENIFDDFTEEVKACHEAKRYGEKIAFRYKEACQQYCDWLNSKAKN